MSDALNAPVNDPLVTKRELALTAIRSVLNGETITKALKEVGLDMHSFFDLVSQDRDLAQRYARAREFATDALVDEAKHIADTEADSSKARNQIDIRKWIASKHNSKVYGERIDLNVAQSISIDVALNEARQRLTGSMRDLPRVEEVQPVDLPSIPDLRATDNESVPRSPVADLGPIPEPEL